MCNTFVFLSAEAFGLTHPDSYHYLRQSSCHADKTINDKGTFQDVLVGGRNSLHSLIKAFITIYSRDSFVILWF